MSLYTKHGQNSRHKRLSSAQSYDKSVVAFGKANLADLKQREDFVLLSHLQVHCAGLACVRVRRLSNILEILHLPSVDGRH